MHVIARKTLLDFWKQNPEAESALKAWFFEAENAAWKNSAEVKAKYRSASIISRERIVFNICGNKFRLVVHVRFDFQKVYVRFVGTHKEYDKIDAETV